MTEETKYKLMQFKISLNEDILDLNMISLFILAVKSPRNQFVES